MPPAPLARQALRTPTARRHQSLDGNAPEPRNIHDGDGTVYAIRHLGGLHHEYRRAG